MHPSGYGRTMLLAAAPAGVGLLILLASQIGTGLTAWSEARRTRSCLRTLLTLNAAVGMAYLDSDGGGFILDGTALDDLVRSGYLQCRPPEAGCEYHGAMPGTPVFCAEHGELTCPERTSSRREGTPTLEITADVRAWSAGRPAWRMAEPMTGFDSPLLLRDLRTLHIARGNRSGDAVELRGPLTPIAYGLPERARSISVYGLLEALASPSPRRRLAALLGLYAWCRVQPAPMQYIVQEIAARRTDPDPGVRATALWTLGACGGEAAMIRPRLEDPDRRTRAFAAFALAHLGDRDGRQRTLSILRDPGRSPRLRSWAAIAIADGAIAQEGDRAWRSWAEIQRRVAEVERLVTSLAATTDHSADETLTDGIRYAARALTGVRSTLEPFRRNAHHFEQRSTGLTAADR